MNKKIFWLLVPTITLVITIGLLVSYLAPHSLSSTSTRADSADALKSISGFRNWTKVNPKPVLMEARTASLCAIVLTPQGTDVNGKTNPHQKKYITVYVNEAGRKAMMEQLNPQFPVGSIIVKEKLSAPPVQTPELLTVMIKREKGFNPGSGDWEFMVADGSGTKIDAQGRLENCQGCHQSRPSSDYIFRSYLPDEARSKLK